MPDTYEAPAIEARTDIEMPLIGNVTSGNVDSSAVFRSTATPRLKAGSSSSV
jgi:hypothetical protein